MSEDYIYMLVGLILLGVFVFIPITIVAIKCTHEDLYDDNDPKNWDLMAKEAKSRYDHTN